MLKTKTAFQVPDAAYGCAQNPAMTYLARSRTQNVEIKSAVATHLSSLLYCQIWSIQSTLHAKAPEIQVCSSSSITVLFLDSTPIFTWCLARWGSRNKHHKSTCSKEIGRCLLILITTLHSIVNTIGRTYVFSEGINKCALPISITEFRIRPIFNLICWCFIVDLLMKHKCNPNQQKSENNAKWTT